LDTLGLVGYFTSLEDISLCPITIYVVGQTLLSSQGTNSTSYVYSHLCFLDKKVNKIQILLQGEKSHKFKVSRYAVKQKRP